MVKRSSVVRQMDEAMLNSVANNTYKYACFYKGKRVEIHAGSAYEATLLALAELKVPAKQKHMVSVILAEKNGKLCWPLLDGNPVYHNGSEL